MAKITVDFSDVVIYSRFLEEGYHEVIVQSAEVVDNKRDGKNIKVVFFSKKDNAIAISYFGLQPKALYILHEFLSALGYAPDNVLTFETNKFVNKSLGIVVKTEEYQGKNVSKVVSYSKLETKIVDEDDDEEY